MATQLPFSADGINSPSVDLGTQQIEANATHLNILVDGAQQWSFDNSGNLTLPANTFAVNYANGTPVPLGGGGGGGGPTTGVITGTIAQDYQVSTNAPTTRSVDAGSTALVEGDFWYGTTSGDLKIWNGDVDDWLPAINTNPVSLINGSSSVRVESSSDIGFVVGGSSKLTLTSNGAALKGYQESVLTTSFDATMLPNVEASTIQRFTATADFTFNGFTNPVAGQSATIIITQDATGGRVMTSTMLFAGGSKTLSTAAGAKDIISLFYDGSTYYASLSKGYA